MNVRVAEEADWAALSRLFAEMYRPGHPLHRRDFWMWQYADAANGRSIVAEDDAGRFVGHVENAADATARGVGGLTPAVLVGVGIAFAGRYHS